MVSRSATSSTPDITGIEITTRNLNTINRNLPVSAIDQLIPLSLKSKEENVPTRFLDQRKDPAQNFLTPIVKGQVLGATGIQNG